jgi:ElaB/YqjD/DUF883 family membrane-anchored ribosome-binding protein
MKMDRALERVLGEMKRVVTQTEALLAEGGEKLGDARAGFATRLKVAKDTLSDLERDAARHARRAARRVDHYAHDNPWRVAGLGVSIALVIGILIGASSRRD